MDSEFEKFFSKKNIKLIENEMQNYLPLLFAQEASLENTNKTMKLFDYIYSVNNRKIIDTFIKYSDLKYEDTLYQNCLAYYLGIKRGIEDRNKKSKRYK